MMGPSQSHFQVGLADEYLRDDLIELEDLQRGYCEAEDYANAYVVSSSIGYYVRTFFVSFTLKRLD